MSPWKIVSQDEQLKRAEFAIANYMDRYVLIAGGYSPSRRLKSVIIYDIQSRTHNRFPDLPHDGGQCGGVMLHDYFYVVGIKFVHRIQICINEESNIVLDRNWETISPYLSDVSGQSFSSDQHFLYSLGGNKNGFYDPRIEKWNAIPQMNTPRKHHTAALIGKKIYVMGGSDLSYNPLKTVEILDIPSLSWTSAPDLPIPKNMFLMDAAAITVDKRFIVVTGGDKFDTEHHCLIFDTYTQKWVNSKFPLARPRKNHGCVAIGNSSIMSIGGLGNTGDHRGDIMNPAEIIDRDKIISNWYIVKHYVLLRRLVDNNRAQSSRMDDVTDKLISFLNMDTFRLVLSFLIKPPIKYAK